MASTDLPAGALSQLILIENMKADFLRFHGRHYLPHVPAESNGVCTACGEQWPCPPSLGESGRPSEPEPLYDVNAALDYIRTMVQDTYDNPESDVQNDLAEAFKKLDEHLCNEGDLPRDWGDV